ncbi:MAG: hypothetical protein R3F59_27640 [Myxococcota bacterium]
MIPLATLAHAAPAPPEPSMASAWIEHVGASLDPALRFEDSDGHRAGAGTWWDGEPVLVQLAWYRCEALCGATSDGLADALAGHGRQRLPRRHRRHRPHRQRRTPLLARPHSPRAGDQVDWRFVHGGLRAR